MNNSLFNENMKLADIIKVNYHLLLTLPRFGIKLGFGDKTVQEICHEHNIPADFFILMCNLYSFDTYIPDNETILNTNMDFLVPYLSSSHNYYLDLQLPHIESHLLKILSDQDDKYASVLKHFFYDYKNEVEQHFSYEENIVFPHILTLQKQQSKTDYQISIFTKTHSNIEDKLVDLSQIIFKYLPEKLSDEESFNIIFDLMELLSDLSTHSMIENKILVPYVQFLEKQNVK